MTRRAGNPRRRPRRALIVAVALIAAVAGPVLGAARPAGAFQYPTTPYSAAGQSPVSAFTVTIDGTGQTSRFGPTTLGGHGYLASDFSPALPTGAPAVEMRTDGTSCLPNTTCTSRGTVAFTFVRPLRNPVIHIAGLGEGSALAGDRSQLQSQLTLTTAGSLTKLAGANLTVSGHTIRPTSTLADADCTTAGAGGAPAACGSVQVTGVVATVTFSVTLVNTIRTGAGVTPAGVGDAFGMAVSFPEDFGDGPASYDAGNAARHVLSHQQLGTVVTADNLTTANATSSPYAGPTATGDADDGLTNPMPVMRIGSTYSLTVPYTGGTYGGGLCGWIDLNRNGTYATTERRCVVTVAGTSSATLTWAGVVGLVAGDTHARFRIAYIEAQAQSPTGPADSGEVEDYVVPVVGANIALTKAAGPIVDVDGNGPDAGDTITYTFTVTNTGTGSPAEARLDPVTVVDPLLGGEVASCAGPLAQGASRTCSAGYTLTAANAGGTTVANTATASGTPPTGPAVTAVASASAPVPVNARLDLTKSASAIADPDANGPDAGDTITYGFTVANTGNTGLDPITVSDPMLGGPVACGSGALAIGTTRTCPTRSYTITQADVGTTIVNTATATGTPPSGAAPTDTASTETSVPVRAQLALSKSAGAIDDVDDNGPDAGDTVTYTFVVGNTGSVALTSVSIDDPLLGGDVPCGTGSLASDTTRTCPTVTYTLVQADIGTDVVNTATASATPPTGPDVTSTDTATTPVPADPHLSLSTTAGTPGDTDGDGYVNAGDTIAFTYVVTNTGSVTIDEIVVTDVTAGAVTCEETALVPGQATDCSSDALYVITEDDVDAGSVSTTADAGGTDPDGGPVESPPGSTTTPIDERAGGLSISLPASTDFGTVESGATSIAGQLGTVTVTDERRVADATWTASVTTTSFTTGGGASGNDVVVDADVSYGSGPATGSSGAGAFVPESGASLDGPDVGVRWTGGDGNNQASWDPTLTLTLSPRLVAGTYTATITHSVA